LLHFLKASWGQHPWLTGIEVLVALLVVSEIVLIGNMFLGMIWGPLTGKADAFVYTRFVFMTGQDAQFGASFLALLGLLPAGLLLALTGGIGWVHAHVVSTQTTAFVHATVGGIVLMVLSVGWILGNNVFGGGILPR